MYVYVYVYGSNIRTEQRSGNIVPTTGHFHLFSSLLSCSPYTLYTARFQFTGHSLDLSDNVLHDWLFPHPWNRVCIKTLRAFNRIRGGRK